MDKIVSGPKIMWNRLSGLLGNMVALLYHVGWSPNHYHRWVDRTGNNWEYKRGFSVMPVVIALQDTVISDMWRAAAQHRNGTGLKYGIAHTETMFLVRKFNKTKNCSRAAALETILCDACWCPTRKLSCGLITDVEARCKNCGVWHCDDFHQFWDVRRLTNQSL